MDNFNIVDRGCGSIWVHKSKPSWVVFYNETNDSRSFYQAYTVMDYCLPVPKYRNCWSLDNRRIGNEKTGFASLDAAFAAIES